MTPAWEPMLHDLATRRAGHLRAFATMLAGASDADDLVQDALIATFSRHRRFESVAHAERYVRRAIATRYVDRVRKAASERRRTRATAPREAIADSTAQVDNRDAIDGALALLAPRVRACIVLRYLEDLSVHETAHALGLSDGAVKRYCSDGLALMGAHLGTTLTDHAGDTSLVSVTARSAR